MAIFVRFGVGESDVWRRGRAANWRELVRGIGRHWPVFVYLVAMMTMMNLSSHGTQDLYPAFLQRSRGLRVKDRSALTAISMVGAILGGLCFGRISDHFGRRRAMAAAFAGAICTVPLSLATHPKNAVLSGTLTAPVVDGVATFNELSLNVPGCYRLVAADSNAIPSITSPPFNVKTCVGDGGRRDEK